MGRFFFIDMEDPNKEIRKTGVVQPMILKKENTSMDKFHHRKLKDKQNIVVKKEAVAQTRDQCRKGHVVIKKMCKRQMKRTEKLKQERKKLQGGRIKQ